MGFTTALSGLNAASTMLQTTGNNIANANTTGFKMSRSEFADVYAGSVAGVSKTTPGAGAAVANVQQSFGQGNMNLTGNAFDLAINGDGFFMLGQSVSNNQQQVFTRSGVFHADETGTVTTNNGQPLMVHQPNGTTVAQGFSSGVAKPLVISTASGLPQPTSKVTTSVTLDSRATIPVNPFVGPQTAGLFSNTGVVDPTTFNNVSSVTAYDSLGNPHIIEQYYVKGSGDPAVPDVVSTNPWTVYTYIDGYPQQPASGPVGVDGLPGPALVAPNPAVQTPAGTRLDFSTTGTMITPATMPIKYDPIDRGSNVSPMTVALDLTGTTQFGSPFSVDTLNQDGFSVGRLTGLNVDSAGVVFAKYSNGSAKPMGQIILARFNDPGSLNKMGDTDWSETAASGVPLIGVGGIGSFGGIKSGALEASNVDLSKELVNLIVAQQAYQANAETIKTENQLTQTLLQIR